MNFNILDYLALIIAIISAIFTGERWYSTNKEQVLRLRPLLYIYDIVIKEMSDNFIQLDMSVKNVGILPAKKVMFILDLYIGKYKTSSPTTNSRALIIPNQILKLSPHVESSTITDVSNDEVQSYFIIKVEYEYNKQQYYFWVKAEYDHEMNILVMSDGDAN